MPELNEQQKELANTIDGMVVVDAGPGTGKTTTIVNRYINLIKNNKDPMDILMLTFTNNAAKDMKAKITKELIALDSEGSDVYRKLAKNVRTTTFDSQCLSIVLDSPECVNEFFGVKESLSRNARLVENETLNREYFRSYYARFINDHSGRYRKNGNDPAALMSGRVNDVYTIINKLMSRGIMPLEYEWFGKGQKMVEGRTEEVFRSLCEKKDKIADAIADMKKTPEDYTLPEIDETKEISEDFIRSVSDEDRTMLLEFIRDVYYGYIKTSIADNRLTFGLVELFAFAILFSDRRSREMHSVSYMTIDEFQDTNELQLKICLLLLKEPNLCAVGDWKQGIYGFRFVSIDNITDFDDRVDLFITELNREDGLVPFRIPSVKHINFTENHRSTPLVLEKTFKSLELRGTKTEEVRNGEIVYLNSARAESFGNHTAFDMIESDSRDEEIEDVVKRILEYISNPRCVVVDRDGERKMKFSDIAVLCRNGKMCRDILERCTQYHIPAFFQGELEVMSTREGKLALAWMRYVNNSKDKKGMMAILSDRGYPLSKIDPILGKGGSFEMPDEFAELRGRLMGKRRRPNDLLTSIFAFYELDNEITQSIINIVSSAYSNSLMTISDLIRLIEDDIANGTKYDVEPSLDAEAVTIQTMHKSKGLEYPAVIIAGINKKSMPNTTGEKTTVRYSDRFGIRCTKEYRVTEVDGTVYEGIVDSWKHKILKTIDEKDYSEDRRLMFVAVSRAKQYVTVTSSDPSEFFTGLGIGMDSEDEKATVLTDAASTLTEAPVIGEYAVRRRSLSPHDLMGLFKDRVEFAEGEGTKYGTKVHEAAYSMWRGNRYDKSLKECDRIREILDSVKDAKTSAEVRFVLPVDDVSIKGAIDLMAEFDDHIEIHDYKTDGTKENIRLYELQLSIYAAAVASTTDKPIECYIDYLNIGSEKVEKITDIDGIKSMVRKYYEALDVPDFL